MTIFFWWGRYINWTQNFISLFLMEGTLWMEDTGWFEYNAGIFYTKMFLSSSLCRNARQMIFWINIKIPSRIYFVGWGLENGQVIISTLGIVILSCQNDPQFVAKRKWPDLFGSWGRETSKWGGFLLLSLEFLLKQLTSCCWSRDTCLALAY